MAENRGSRRQVFHYNARIAAEPNAPQVKCMITDISKTGAHLVLERDEPLAADFLLLFTPQGWPRRNCSLAWRKGREIGVRFREE
jgi:hypothetical protein